MKIVISSLEFNEDEIGYLVKHSYETTPQDSWRLIDGNYFMPSERGVATFPENDDYINAKILAQAFKRMGFKATIYTCEELEEYLVFRSSD